MSYTHIFPKLFSEFKCIADKCPANCCRAGWSITWTAQEVEKLCSAAGKELSSIFVGDEYKTIKLSENSECPMLTAEGLCSIQKNYGEHHLSYTCRQYPRISRLCGGIMLSSCRPTCYAVMDKLFSEKDIMKLNEKQSVSPMEAILTADGEVTERLVFFKRASEALWNGSILTASDRLASIYNIKKPDDIQQRFAQRYGWEIITADGGELPEYAMRNIVLAYFMEWMMTRYDAGLSDAENMSEFLFRAQALMLATKGAAALCTDRTQLLCSISDFIAAL